MVDWRKQLLSWDLWGSCFYGLGQAFLFLFWLSVAFAILSTYSSPIGYESYRVAAVLGTVGAFWYALRKYERVIADG